MSDETPRDDWLPSASRNTDEARKADDLEAFLASLMDMRADARSRPSDLTTLSAPTAAQVSDKQLAYLLVEIGAGITPDAGFAADLRAQIERHIRERDHDDADETGGDTGGAGGPADSSYGRTTRLRTTLGRYRPVWATIAALLLLTLLLALPVQAALKRPLCLGSVCIVWGSAPHPTVGPHRAATPQPTPLASDLDLAGRATLAQARAQATFPIRLPTYPTELGQPDDVFLQDLNGSAVVLVWVDHAHPDRVRLSLSELSSGIFVYKFLTQPIAVTTVHGQQAFWTTGPYLVELHDGTQVMRQFVTGHTLIWTEGGITYRLETTTPLDEAVRTAESLR